MVMHTCSCHMDRYGSLHEDILHTHLCDTLAHRCGSRMTADGHTPGHSATPDWHTDALPSSCHTHTSVHSLWGTAHTHLHDRCVCRCASCRVRCGCRSSRRSRLYYCSGVGQGQLSHTHMTHSPSLDMEDTDLDGRAEGSDVHMVV